MVFGVKTQSHNWKHVRSTHTRLPPINSDSCTKSSGEGTGTSVVSEAFQAILMLLQFEKALKSNYLDGVDWLVTCLHSRAAMYCKKKKMVPVFFTWDIKKKLPRFYTNLIILFWVGPEFWDGLSIPNLEILKCPQPRTFWVRTWFQNCKIPYLL